MKFTLSWLKEHLETDATLAEIADKLTMIGLEVEHIDDKAAELAPFTTARVVSAEPHPDADRLRVCQVDAGDGKPVQVVCGAPNARAGMIGVFARPGTHIPGTGLDLKVGKIRGQESHGMLVSAREMGISDDHDGILELPPETPLGRPFAPLLGLDDPAIEIAVTPNRADCLGVHGIARDLAASMIGRMKETRTAILKGESPCPVAVRIEDPALCPAFALRLVRGVKNGPSPEWLTRRLRAIGLRPINALVDITNFLTFDRARPLHVFDAAKVKGDLVIRRARQGETLLALDGKSYELDNDCCVIADDAGVESLAGIMGGEASGCSEATTDVLIESALWNPVNIARTGRRLGIHSDARFRFERGVDPAYTLPGLDLATALVLELCGGTPSQPVLAGTIPDSERVIEFPLKETRRLAAIETVAGEVRRVLTALGFIVVGSGETVKVAVPSWRGDVEGKADLVEEIVRIVGVDRVPATPFPRGASARKPVLTPLQKRTRAAKRALAASGLVEAVTWSFISRPQAELFGGGKAELALANPIAADLSDMRPSLIPGLVLAAQNNADRGYADAALFEVGQIFLGDTADEQRIAAASVRRAAAKAAGGGRHWSGTSGTVDVFDAKADALEVLAACGASVDRLQIVPGGSAYLHPGRSGTLRLGPKNVLAVFGELHPAACEALGVEGPLAVAEVILDHIPVPKAKPTRMKPALALSPFQPISRDFAFIVDRAVASADIVKAAQAADKNLIAAVEVFDLYEGKGIEPGKKSIAVAVTLQPHDKTLNDGEIEAIAGRIVEAVKQKTGAALRG